MKYSYNVQGDWNIHTTCLDKHNIRVEILEEYRKFYSKWNYHNRPYKEWNLSWTVVYTTA